ncbi:unnamed protein product [Lupinus luteus]|uniref:Uncharacterized protein n=1 Tax=Lupinus luteus TaxID=3873 RepID=A0AAV1WTY7_LUPLU
MNQINSATEISIGTLMTENEKIKEQNVYKIKLYMTMPEMCSYFMGTLGAPYVGIMAGVTYKDFRELMDVGDRIEMLLKAVKLSIAEGDGIAAKKNFLQRRKRMK